MRNYDRINAAPDRITEAGAALRSVGAAHVAT